MRTKLNTALLRGSIVLLVAFGTYNLFNFIFQLSMARLLTVAEYGVLATLFSILYLFSVFSESIQLVITKYTSSESNPGKLKNILKRSLKKSLISSTAVFSLYALVSIFLTFILNIPYPLLLLHGTLIFFMMLLPVTRGVMQGRKLFGTLGGNMVLESLTKLIFAVGLVVLGFGVFGAIGAVFLGTGVAFVFSLYTLKKIRMSEEKKAITPQIYGYSLPVFIVVLAITVFYSLDIIIARVVFDAETAGHYAIASILSKIIFWGTQPISKAMFPITAKETSEKKPSKEVYFNALGILCALSIIALGAFYFFPGEIVSIFSGKTADVSASILFYLGIGTALLSLSNLNLLYQLSTGKTKKYWLFLFFIVLEVLLLTYFSENVVEFSFAFIVASAAFLWGTSFLMRE